LAFLRQGKNVLRIELSCAQGGDGSSIVGGAAECDSLSLDDFLED
jgi:hypothetical protein